jgi:hypothetical protein
MIACNDTDLFGGHISTVASIQFCCQIETAGEGLRLAPVTSIHDLTQPGDATESRPVIVLHYDAIWHTTNLSAPHKLIVNFMESIAGGDNRISLRQALDMTSLKFGYFGAWKWPPAPVTQFDAKHRLDTREALLIPAPGRRHPAAFAGISPEWTADFQGHMDSPLAG